MDEVINQATSFEKLGVVGVLGFFLLSFMAGALLLFRFVKTHVIGFFEKLLNSLEKIGDSIAKYETLQVENIEVQRSLKDQLKETENRYEKLTETVNILVAKQELANELYHKSKGGKS